MVGNIERGEGMTTKYHVEQITASGGVRRHSFGFYISTLDMLREAGLVRGINDKNIRHAKRAVDYIRKQWPNARFRLIKIVTKRTEIDF
jgi:hypothetical protein